MPDDGQRNGHGVIVIGASAGGVEALREEAAVSKRQVETAYEELSSTNEELQSTNEELETMNDELQQRTDELNEVNAFLESVLGSLRAGVVVVDKDLHVTGWNDAAFELWGLRPDEVLEKHPMNLDIGLPVERLRGPVRDVLSGNGQPEITLQAVNRRGRTVTCRIELVPLDGVDGVRGAILMLHSREEQPR